MKALAKRHKTALLVLLLMLLSFTIYAHRVVTTARHNDSILTWRAVITGTPDGGQPRKPAPPAATPSPDDQKTKVSAEAAQPGLSLQQSASTGGGGTSAGGNRSLTGTAGQGFAGATSGGQFTLGGGFWGGGSLAQCPTIIIEPSALPAGQLGQPYSRQLTQTGGTGAITWSKASGELPNNVTLNAISGLLDGTPTTGGTFNFQVKATDANGCIGTRAYSLVIGACPAITILPGTLPTGTVGSPYNQTLTANGGTPPLTFRLGSGAQLPTGLSLLGGNSISGTPTLAGSFNFSIIVTDANGCSGTQGYTLTINPGRFAVSGRVTDLAGNGLAEATLSFSNTSAGDLGTVQTDANGNWTRSGFDPLLTSSACTANPYVVRPSKPGFSFTPAPRSFCVATANLNFIGVAVVTSVNAASFLGQELAQESIAAAFGVNLATRVEAATALPLPTTLAGTRVKITDSAGTERNAPLFFVAPSQINYQIPLGTAIGQATVTVTSGNNNVSVGAINVSRVAPGLLTANASGRGLPAAIVLRIRNGAQTFEPVARFDAGQNSIVPVPIDLGPPSDMVYLLLYGVGIRQRTRVENINANLGGVVKGLSPANFEDGVAVEGFVGLDQVNVLLPRSLAGGGNVNVTLTVDGKSSNTVQINIR